MAEVLGIVAAIIGVADVGVKLSMSLYKYSHALATRAVEIKKVSSEVSLLSAVLRQLGSSLRDDDYLRVCKPQTLATTQEIAQECAAAFQELDQTIAGYAGNVKTGLIDRLKWPYVEKKVNLLRTNVERLKTSLILMLEVLGHARSIMKYGPNYDAGDRDIIVAMHETNITVTENYEKLLRAIQDAGSSMEHHFSNLAISPTSTLVSESKNLSYTVTGISGNHRKGNLALKLEAISQLISEVEDTQADIAKVADRSGIWESFLGDGDHHFRHTEITRHPQMPVKDTVEGVRGIESQHLVIGDLFKFNPFTRQSEVLTTAPPVRDIYIALMGAVGAGKSTFVNLCCGENLAPVSQGVDHCTESFEAYHFMYTPEIRVHLIDSPGFAPAHRSDREILLDLVEWVDNSSAAVTRLSGIIYFHKLSDLTRHGSVHRNSRIFEKLCSSDPHHSVIMAITSWGFFGDLEAAMVREEELQGHDEHWGLMIKRGSCVLRHSGDKDSAMRILGTFIPLDSARLAFQSETEPVERKRGFSDSSIKVDVKNTEAEVNQLLAEYTTIFDGPPAQQRRWTLGQIY